VSQDGTLSIQDLGVADQGRYECIARNPFGFTSSAMQLTITGSVPPAAAPFCPRASKNYVVLMAAL